MYQPVVVNNTLSQGQVVQRYLNLAHHYMNGVTWVFHPFIYQVELMYIALANYHINSVTITYSTIFIRWKFPVNIFLQLNTYQFASGRIYRCFGQLG